MATAVSASPTVSSTSAEDPGSGGTLRRIGPEPLASTDGGAGTLAT
jgi:hypothetical protein